jgi:hypothetical protein
MEGQTFELDFRRLQIHEQQTEKQRRNPLQKTLVFSWRAKELMTQDMGSHDFATGPDS